MVQVIFPRDAPGQVGPAGTDNKMMKRCCIHSRRERVSLQKKIGGERGEVAPGWHLLPLFECSLNSTNNSDPEHTFVTYNNIFKKRTFFLLQPAHLAFKNIKTGTEAGLMQAVFFYRPRGGGSRGFPGLGAHPGVVILANFGQTCAWAPPPGG